MEQLARLALLALLVALRVRLARRARQQERLDRLAARAARLARLAPRGSLAQRVRKRLRASPALRASLDRLGLLPWLELQRVRLALQAAPRASKALPARPASPAQLVVLGLPLARLALLAPSAQPGSRAGRV